MIEGIHYSKEIESAVLGICIMEKLAFGRTFGMIDEKVFYYDDNKSVYHTLREMYDSSIPIDSLTVWQKMVNDGSKLLAKNIPWYLSQLTMQVVSSAHLEYHCFLLKKFWQRRELETITRSGIEVGGDERRQAAGITERINEILGGELKQDWYSMDQLMFDLILHQEDMKSGKKEFISTGFKGIDKLNGGFSPGQMVVIGARPSVGKSALMGKMATSISKKGKVVGIISLEMVNNEIAARIASIETDTSFSVVYRNLFQDESENRSFYDKISKHTVHLPIFISDKTKVDISEIRAKAIKLKHAHGLDILMIDYLQLIESTGLNKNYNREQEVAKLSRGLKLLAMDLQIPVVVLCQLNRAVVHRKGKDRYPQASDLRESGSIEQDADVILMLHRDWMVGIPEFPEGDQRQGDSTEFSADLICVKWRSGATFHLELDFNPQLMKFTEQVATSWIPFTPAKDDEEIAF
jgi:replicative DNA helicase